MQRRSTRTASCVKVTENDLSMVCKHKSWRIFRFRPDVQGERVCVRISETLEKYYRIRGIEVKNAPLVSACPGSSSGNIKRVLIEGVF